MVKRRVSIFNKVTNRRNKIFFNKWLIAPLAILIFVIFLLLFNSSPPQILSASVYPTKVRPGEVMLVTVVVKGSVSSVTAENTHNLGKDKINLQLKKIENGTRIYEGSWIVHDTTGQLPYRTYVTVAGKLGKTSTEQVEWLDPTVSHKASDITAGTFGAGNYVFPSNLNVSGDLNLSMNLTCSKCIGASDLADASISQAKLKTSTGSVGTSVSGWAYLTLPGGDYGFYPQTYKSNADTTVDFAITIKGAGDGELILNTPTSFIHLYRATVYANIGASQRYISASGKDHWIFLLVAKRDYQVTLLNGQIELVKKGKVLSSYEAPDHPSANQGGATESDLPHPFGSYNPANHEIVLVDNDILNIAKTRINRKRNLLTVINEDFIIDDTQRPIYEPREIIKINEYPNEPIGKVIARIKTPEWAKIMIQSDEITLEQRIVEKLPDYILYRKMKLK